MAADLTVLDTVTYRGKEVTAPRLRGLLALLAGDLRSGCSTARLVNGLWSDEQPENPTKAVQILVSRARALLGADLIASTPTGYRLTLSEDQVDAAAVLARAAASAQRARSGEHGAALAQAEAGLALWDTAPADDAAQGDPVTALRRERASTYRSLVRARALSLARLARYGEAVGPLTELAQQWPRDEEVLLELLRCEQATAGSAAALTRYESYRRSLRDDLGTDPGPALQALQRELLHGSTPPSRHGVPHESNPLLGRADDIAAVTALLRTSRVASIVGPGGLGKTRLAHAVSREAEHRIVHLVGLAAIGSDAEVIGEVSAALGVGELRRTPMGAPGTPGDALSGIVAALSPGPALLVLDNCEHVIDGAAEVVRALVAATRDVRVLTTSRAPLGLSSESVYLLPELDLATATELFRQRARAARPGIDLPAGAVTDAVRQLDGLPLAIELAAARVRAMSIVELSERLADRFALLRGGPRDSPERHRTLHAVVDWSWNLLDPAEQAAMRALSVFADGFTADAAGVLIGGDALPVLEQLIDQSLVRATDTATGTRFSMLETVREFSSAQRTAEGEIGSVIEGLLAWARGFGLAHHEALFGADPYSTVDLIRAEQDNLVQALRHAVARGDGASTAATCAVLQSLWTVESNFIRLAELAEETAWVLSHYRPEPEFVEVTRATLTLSTMYAFLIQGPRAVRSLIALRRLPAAPPTTVIRAAAVVVLAASTDPAALFTLAESPQLLVAGAANGVAGYVYENIGELESALTASHRMLDVFGDGRAPWLATVGQARIAELCLQLEHGEEALRHLTAALPMCDRLGAWSDVVGLRWWMVLANLQLGAVDEAEHWLSQTAADRAEDPSAHTYGLGVRAEILLARGHVDAGLETWRRAVDTLARVREPTTRRFSDDADPWTLEATAVTVVAHARNGRLDQVAELAARLPDHLWAILTEPVLNPPPYLLEFPVCGAVLLALATADLASAEASSVDLASAETSSVDLASAETSSVDLASAETSSVDLASAEASSVDRAQNAVRMIALAQRFRYLRAFQPTMSSARARAAAERADQAAYEDAVSSYAALVDRDELRAAALTLLQARKH